ncbi:MAG TPA: C45 family peptidase [Pseudogracilibacillus sp.]|nr:C45 family peptidase [Pseudogracilibacillus sp.]
MQEVYSEVIQFRGNHFDFGYYQGELLKNTPIVHNYYKKIFAKNTTRFNVNVDDYIAIMTKYAPSILDELYGLQKSLQLSLYDTIRLFGGYYLEFGRSGCSIYSDHSYMVRNYDNDPLTYEGRFVLFQPNDGSYASLGPSMQITGRMDGMNEHGLSIGYNFINRKQSDDGFMCNMIARIVLETCQTTEDAIQCLKDLPHRNSFIYALTDKNDASIVVEASPREVIVRHDVACANHFESLTHENRYRMDDSIRRTSIMSDYKKQIHRPMDAYQLMNNLENHIFSTSYGSWSGTLHTAIYLPDELQVGFTLGFNRLPYMFDFKRWLQGKNTSVKKVRGELQSTYPFLNMITL